MDRQDFFSRRAILGGSLVAGLSAILPATTWAATPFTSRRITVSVTGRGRDVLLIPGLGTGASVWNGTVAAVLGYRYHRVQVRGFAGSAGEDNRKGPMLIPLAQDIARYIRSAGLKRPAVVGHSMGGTLAMMLASMTPSPVGRAMVVDMLPAGAGMVGGTANGMGFLSNQLYSYFTGTAAGRKLFADMLKNMTPAGSTNDPDVIAQALNDLAQTDLTPRLPRITVPLTVVYAIDADAKLRTSQNQRYRAAYASAKSAKLLPVGPSGHMIMGDQPAKFAAALRDFLKP